MKKNALLPLLALASILAGCQSDQTLTTVTAGSEPLVCTQWQPITYASKHDTSETVTEVRRSNARRAAYCGEP